MLFDGERERESIEGGKRAHRQILVIRVQSANSIIIGLVVVGLSTSQVCNTRIAMLH